MTRTQKSPATKMVRLPLALMREVQRLAAREERSATWMVATLLREALAARQQRAA